MRAEPLPAAPPSAALPDHVSEAPPLGIERAGVEPVPTDRRHGRPRSLFTLWFGANVQFATLSVGALSTSVFGLDLLPAVLAIAVGTVLSAVMVGLFSTRGPLTGVLQLIQTRGPFGRLGALPRRPSPSSTVSAGASSTHSSACSSCAI